MGAFKKNFDNERERLQRMKIELESQQMSIENEKSRIHNERENLEQL